MFKLTLGISRGVNNVVVDENNPFQFLFANTSGLTNFWRSFPSEGIWPPLGVESNLALATGLFPRTLFP